MMIHRSTFTIKGPILAGNHLLVRLSTGRGKKKQSFRNILQVSDTLGNTYERIGGGDWLARNCAGGSCTLNFDVFNYEAGFYIEITEINAEKVRSLGPKSATQGG
ncbi:MAG: hypothetical protein WBQ94_02790 [Terracidiphilus sp.]